MIDYPFPISAVKGEARDALERWAVLAVYRGSIAHGMYVPNTDPHSVDDRDVMIFVVPDRRYFMGLHQFPEAKARGSLHNLRSRGTMEIKIDQWDIVVYEIRKALYLLSKGNPNILLSLWAEPRHYLHRSRAADLLLGLRGIFSCKHIFSSFMGYANNQLSKMKSGGEQGYMGAKRKALREKFGYDVKNAAHLIRLLRMCIEILHTGELIVDRPDAAELLEIKLGKWPLERVLEESDSLFRRAKVAREQSELPEGPPDFEAVSRLCTQIVALAWAERKEYEQDAAGALYLREQKSGGSPY